MRATAAPCCGQKWTEPAWKRWRKRLTLAGVPPNWAGGADAPTASLYCAKPAVFRGIRAGKPVGGLAARPWSISSPRGAMSCGPTRRRPLTLTKGGTLLQHTSIPLARAPNTLRAGRARGCGTAGRGGTGAVRTRMLKHRGGRTQRVIFDGAQQVAAKRTRRPRRRSTPAQGRHGTGMQRPARGSHSRACQYANERVRSNGDREVPGCSTTSTRCRETAVAWRRRARRPRRLQRYIPSPCRSALRHDRGGRGRRFLEAARPRFVRRGGRRGRPIAHRCRRHRFTKETPAAPRNSALGMRDDFGNEALGGENRQSRGRQAPIAVADAGGG